jgi:outer membrane autotransporter protein
MLNFERATPHTIYHYRSLVLTPLALALAAALLLPQSAQATDSTFNTDIGNDSWYGNDGARHTDTTTLSGSPSGNTVTVEDQAKTGRYVHGGVGYGTNWEANGNTVNMKGGSVEWGIYGGQADNSGGWQGNVIANGNRVTISGGTVGDRVFGGEATNGVLTTANGNSVTISGGAVGGDVYGGFAQGSGSLATTNSVTISGGTVGGDVYGAHLYINSGTGSATGNTVTISGAASLATSSNIYGGHLAGSVAGSDAFTGNTLNINNWRGTVASIQNFQTINFTLPANVAANEAIVSANSLTLGNGVTGTTVGVAFAGRPSALQLGQKIRLVSTTSGITGELANDKVTSTYGATDYTFDLAKEANDLTATWDGGKTINHTKAQAYTYGSAAKAALLNDGYDHALGLIDHWKYSQQGRFSPEPGASSNGFTAFASMQGATSKVKTGSSVNNNGVSFMLGGAFDMNTSSGNLLLGLFAEGGMGSYDAYSSYGNADGDTWHYGIGAFAKHTFINGFYVEGSIRGGRVKADYEGRDNMAYSGQNWYWGAHAGLGYEYRLSRHSMLDGYAKVIWTQQESDTVRTKHDEELHFDQMDSVRSRVGARYIHHTDKGIRWWGGLA